MLLTPQHFQQADNYTEDIINTRVASLLPYEWGVLDLQINRDMIANGSVQLISCRAVMEDGLIVNIPHPYPAPDVRPVGEHFSSTADRLGVYLAAPAAHDGAPSFQSNGGPANPSVRFLQDAIPVMDETSPDPNSMQQLAFARPNLRLLFAGESHEGYSTIKIAELQRTATGKLELSEEYVAPALHFGAAKWLGNLLKEMIEFLIAKSRTLGERRHQSGSGQAVFSTDDGMVLWVLPTLNASISVLNHLVRQRIVHPERLYTELARLAGALMTLSFDRHAKDLPRYEHLDLHNTFRRLDFEIRSLLEKVDPQRYVPIPLVRESPSVYVGRVNDDQLLRNAEFYLAVGAKVPENKLIERVPFAIKIADSDNIKLIMDSSLSGLSMTHVRPPGQIPTRQGLHYFRLDRNDLDMALKNRWDFIIATKTISVWVADEFPEAKLEMYAIKPR